jgi:hypothetical protein
MPRILDAAVRKIKKASPGVNPYAVATATLQKAGELKPGSNKPTPLGVKRGAMTSEQRQAKPLGGSRKSASKPSKLGSKLASLAR